MSDETILVVDAEEIINLPIKTALPYMGGNFALAINLNQPIILKYPEDTAAIFFKETASNMIKTVIDLRSG